MSIKQYFLKLYIYGKEQDISMLIGFDLQQIGLKNAFAILNKMSKEDIDKIELKINYLYLKHKAENTKIIARTKRKLINF